MNPTCRQGVGKFFLQSKKLQCNRYKYFRLCEPRDKIKDVI